MSGFRPFRVPGRHLALLLGALLGGAGCGGGGAAGGTGDVVLTLAASSDAALFTSGPVNTLPGLHVGQFVGIGMVSGIRFPVFPVLDAGRTIVSARLLLRQVSVSGAPFTAHGSVVVDQVDFGASLGAGSQAAPVLSSAVGTLSSDGTLGTKDVDVTAAVAAAAAANALTVDFLLRFNALVLGPPVDYVSFENRAGALETSELPELVVTYR